MNTHLDTVFWSYFDEYLKKDSLIDAKKIKNIDKQKINEIYDVTHFALFQLQLLKNTSLQEISPENYKDISNYVLKNYNELFLFTYQDKNVKSMFESIDEENSLYIKDLIENFILNHIGKVCFTNSDDKAMQNYYWAYSSLCNLISKFEYDLSYKNEKEKKYYYSVVYPFLLTAMIIDTLDPKNMVDKIKKIFTRENIAEAFKNGRSLTTEEKEWILPQIGMLKDEDDWNAFIINFKKQIWETYDNNKRFKLVHELSKLTILFLRDGFTSISLIDEGEEIFEVLYPYLPTFLSTDKESKTISHKSLDGQVKITRLLNSINTKDFNPIWTINHIKKFKEYKRLKFKSEKLVDFIARTRYVTSYMEIVNKTKRNNGVIGDKLIEFKKISIVNTLNFFTQEDKKYNFAYKSVAFKAINLDLKQFSKLTQKVNRFEEIADNSTQMSIMLRIITLIITLDPKAPKAFDYSWELLVKYYIIAFGPYKKNMFIYSNKDIEMIDFKVNKLLIQYETLKQKEKVIDSIGIIEKLHNFK